MLTALYVQQSHQGTGTRWRRLVSAVWEQHWSSSGCWGTRRACLSVSGSPDCKEVFPMSNARPSSAPECSTPYSSSGTSVCPAALLQRDRCESTRRLRLSLAGNHRPWSFQLGRSTPCTLAPTQHEGERWRPRDLYSEILGLPVFSNVPSGYCQLARR